MLRSAAPLREREFRLLFVGRTISLVGTAIAPVALAFAVLDPTRGLRFLAELAVGWREFRSREWLWSIVLQFSLLWMVSIGAFSVLGPLIADEKLGGAKARGAILTAQAAGIVAADVGKKPSRR